MRNLWGKVQGDPLFLRKVYGWMIVVSVLMMPITYLTGLQNKVAYVTKLSEVALTLALLASWQGSQIAVTQKKEADERLARPVEAKVVEKIIAETTIEPCSDV